MEMSNNRYYHPTLNKQKLKELILYILGKYPEGLTEEQLCWILFRIDMQAFLRLGHSITGARYVKGSVCPIPSE
jgi:hypothetical protein